MVGVAFEKAPAEGVEVDEDDPRVLAELLLDQRGQLVEAAAQSSRSTGVAPLAQLGDELVAVLRVAREQRQLDARVADRDDGRLALVLDLDDVHALRGEQVEQLRQLARAGPGTRVRRTR